jgi:tripartite-type tricarboxylate transporter receptor subunit TctC
MPSVVNSLKRTTLAAALSAIAITALPSTAIAQAWPAKPITIVVSYPPGGDTDVIMRAYAEKLSQRLGQSVVIDNKPGASGTIGNSFVAKSAPDGYTFLFTPNTFAIAQHVLKVSPSVAHDVNKDFTPVIKTGNIPLLLFTNNTSGIKDMRGFVAEAKSGKIVNYGSPGAGSPMHIAAEMLNKDAGIKTTHVPYRGVAPLIPDVISGNVTVGWVTPGAVASFNATGKIVPLAIADTQRSKALPNTPTLIELGYKNLDVPAWMGLLGPKGLSPDIVRVLNGHMNEILKMSDIQARMATMGIDSVGGDAGVLAKQILDDDARYGKVVQEFGIKAE